MRVFIRCVQWCLSLGLLWPAYSAAVEDKPGYAAPDQTQPIQSQVIHIAWGADGRGGWEHRSVVAIDAQVRPDGAVRSVLVGTWATDETRRFLVMHPGTAYRSSDGSLHIRCHGLATWTDPMLFSEWSPDSFSLAPDGSVHVLDDQGRGGPGGTVNSQVFGDAAAKAAVLRIVTAAGRIQ